LKKREKKKLIKNHKFIISMIYNSKFKIIILFILIIVLILPNFQGLAMTPQERLQQQRAYEVQLRELEELERQYEANIRKTEQEKRTLRRQISFLRNRIGQLNAQIQQGNIEMRRLDAEIMKTELSIEETSLEIQKSREQLGAILRVIKREDQRPIIEVFLAGQTLSDFFNNLTALERLNIENKNILERLKVFNIRLVGQKEVAEERRQDTERLVAGQILRREEEARARAERERLMRMTEAEHQQYLRKKRDVERRAAEIRARLLVLVDIPDAPTFTQALELAQWVEQKTGIRPAFLLAIITQESALGRNVGRCHLVDFETGKSVHIRTGERKARGMNPRRDVPHFLNITRELGRDPRQTLISCPMARGWGGAMGPAQFIPSTWINRRPILEEFIPNPDPWNIRHAFLASGLYLRDLGGRTNERRAALQYFAGGNWANPAFAFYGNQVVQRINCLQIFIDHGTMTAACERMIFIPR